MMKFGVRYVHGGGRQCLVRIHNALFKNHLGAVADDHNLVFPKPIGALEIWQERAKGCNWAFLGPGKSLLLKILAGQYIADPPTSRTYPFKLVERDYRSIQFLDFKEASSLEKVHLSARYESLASLESSGLSGDDNSVLKFITDQSNYNSNVAARKDDRFISSLLLYLNLEHLKHKWINSLSNGQLRRARLARALAHRPTMLIIDDPFLGLDPEATVMVSDSLDKVSKNIGTSLIIGLRLQDSIPNWISNLGYVTNEGLLYADRKEKVLPKIEANLSDTNVYHNRHDIEVKNKHPKQLPPGHFLDEGGPYHIEFKNASVVYKGKPVLLNLNWKVPPRSKWRILGNNGTGKTTLLSFITGDHPQSWRNVLYINGKLRKTGSGLTFFDINNEIGMSSPELHSLVPGSQTMKQVILNGLVKDVGNSNFLFKGSEKNLGPHAKRILAKFDDVLEKYGNCPFSDLSVSNQKLSLFLRAIVKNPKILILDEAFSCMDDESIMKRCHDIVENDLKDTTVFSIAHIDWELPSCDYVLHLSGDKERSYEVMKYK